MKAVSFYKSLPIAGIVGLFAYAGGWSDYQFRRI
jgi:hypothetical protein